jgi:hypothetical protein
MQDEPPKRKMKSRGLHRTVPTDAPKSEPDGQADAGRTRYKAIAIKTWQTDAMYEISLVEGNSYTVEQNDEENGWACCVSGEGVTGWAPSKYLEPEVEALQHRPARELVP